MSSSGSSSGSSSEPGKRKKSKSKSEDKSRIYDPTIFQVRLVDKVYEPHHEIAADLRHSTPQAILRDLARPEKKFMINPHEWETVEVPIDGGRSETRGLRQMRYANYRIRALGDRDGRPHAEGRLGRGPRGHRCAVGRRAALRLAKRSALADLRLNGSEAFISFVQKIGNGQTAGGS